ncbi:MAG: hypothetical protein Terrestrivirus10_3 [Terrestrivirus sp.]|uniref:Uncharacterized protein n=1 Tax=Terrestrivirus sp. TaxID=2487775 RepID=A0A3G4ZT50_9VIRU|nr:MAG: hypothetical protein Terrestrivirus10_3 [Terrestrivirus sp.]
MEIINRRGFTVIANSGCEGRYKYTCIFISILDFFRFCRRVPAENQVLTIDDIREISQFSEIGRYNEMFDIDKLGHRGCLIRLLEIFDISLDIYHYNVSQNRNGIVNTCWIGEPGFQFNQNNQNNQNNHIAIISYGSHFELIISETPTTRALDIDHILVTQHGRRCFDYAYNPRTHEQNRNQNRQNHQNRSHRNQRRKNRNKTKHIQQNQEVYTKTNDSAWNDLLINRMIANQQINNLIEETRGITEEYVALSAVLGHDGNTMDIDMLTIHDRINITRQEILRVGKIVQSLLETINVIDEQMNNN